MVRFSIVIPNYNGLSFIKPCLDSIGCQSFTDYEVIFVDNASSDGSVELVQSDYSHIILYCNSTNRGYAGGCNDGWKVARGELILMLNSDTILKEDCLFELDKATKKFSSFGMYAPKILYKDGRINAAGCDLSISGASWERGKGQCDGVEFDEPCKVFGPYGAAALFQRELLYRTGGFDEDFFMFVEETDLSFRAYFFGYSCLYVPSAVIIHHHGGTAGRTSDLSLYYLHRNSIWFVLSNFPILLLIMSFPLFFIRNVIVLIFYLCLGRGQVVFQAKIDAIRGLPNALIKRGMRKPNSLPRSLPMHVMKSWKLGEIFKKR